MNPIATIRFASLWTKILPIMLLMILPTLLGGCVPKVTLGGKSLQGMGEDGTSVLGIATRILTRDEIVTGAEDAGHRLPPIYQELINNGFSDQDLVDGKVVIILYQGYRHNRSRVHDHLDWALVEKGVTVKTNSLVELQWRKPYAFVTQVLYEDWKQSGCEFGKGDRGGFAALDAINLGGGPAMFNLYCPQLEQEGWQKTKYGMYVGGFLMTKPPKP